ncbi:MAG: hypothetical protein OES38_12825 [Gammaproteobacteria bacterium]|nr:hypothetical protein [Gammaproteobacteria bacterium]
MTDINIDDFFKDSAKVLVQLYSVFPRRHTVFVEDVSGPDETDEFGMHSTRYLACFGTLLWLGEEGYLRYEDSIRQDAIDQAVLSARCFTLLTTPAPNNEPMDVTDLPELVRLEQSTTISRLRNSLKERSSARVRAAMVDLMAQMRTQSPPSA